MAPANTTEKLGATPGKIAAIAVLAVVLIVVVVMQFGSSDEATPAASRLPKSRAKLARSRGPGLESAAVPAPTAKLARQWPKISREEIQSYNPFVLSGSVAPRQDIAAETEGPGDAAMQSAAAEKAVDDHLREQREQMLSELRRDGIQMIVVSGQQSVATIGAQQVRVGDVLNGFRVVEIGASGVVLTEHRDAAK